MGKAARQRCIRLLENGKLSRQSYPIRTVCVGINWIAPPFLLSHKHCHYP